MTLSNDNTTPAGESAAYPGSDAFRQLVNTLQAAGRPAPAHIQHQFDPARPNRTAYLVSAGTEAAVLVAIMRLNDTVDTAFGGVPGRARWQGPIKDCDGGWVALGEVVVEVAP